MHELAKQAGVELPSVLGKVREGTDDPIRPTYADSRRGGTDGSAKA